MPVLENKQREKFAQEYAKGGKTKCDAYTAAGYKATDKNNARSTAAAHLAKEPEVAERLKELAEAAASDTVLSIRERKEILSELGRGKLSDYMNAEGTEANIQYGEESPRPRAVQSLTVKREVFSRDGEDAETTTTKIKLMNPVQAIHELNKMEGEHAPEKHDHTGQLTVNFEGREDGTKPPKD